MAAPRRLVTAGRVGRPHGLDGSFAVLDAQHSFDPGTTVTVAGVRRHVKCLGGTSERPLVRLEGIMDREGARALGGELLLVATPGLAAGEWLATDLVGCRVDGVGEVVRVLTGPSCDVLELTDGTLVPLVADAVKSVDAAARRIEVDRGFLGLRERP